MAAERSDFGTKKCFFSFPPVPEVSPSDEHAPSLSDAPAAVGAAAARDGGDGGDGVAGGGGGGVMEMEAAPVPAEQEGETEKVLLRAEVEPAPAGYCSKMAPAARRDSYGSVRCVPVPSGGNGNGGNGKRWPDSKTPKSSNLSPGGGRVQPAASCSSFSSCNCSSLNGSVNDVEGNDDLYRDLLRGYGDDQAAAGSAADQGFQNPAGLDEGLAAGPDSDRV